MDGTGVLFTPLLEHIQKSLPFEIVPLSTFSADCPKQQAKELAQRLNSQEVIIFAESYSGLIAYELCQLKGLNIKHIIFAASFLERPSVLSKFAHLLPISLIQKRLIPDAMLSYVLFGGHKSKELVDLFYQSLQHTSIKTLKRRLKRIQHAQKPTQPIMLPVTYIKANRDYLVSPKVLGCFKHLCMDFNIIHINGGHFIAQSNPTACWAVLHTIMSQILDSTQI